ncbi:MAG: hypothetical protein DRI44_09905 [Chlamydiae bacterium]|nr:MAG: hypothetical protein DRI44_09905 [Chlamydiota bacterium]
MKNIIVLLISFTIIASANIFNVNDVNSFQNALTTAQGNGQDNTINVAAATYNVSTPLSYIGSGSSLSIIGVGAGTTILDGGNAVQIMNIDQSTSGDILISGLTFRNGSNYVNDASNGGGLALACNDSCSATLASCVFSNNITAFGGGGAIVYVGDGNITITNCLATKNSTYIDDAGGLSAQKESGTGFIFIADNIFYDNHLGTSSAAVGDVEGSAFYVYSLCPSCDITISNNLAYGNSLKNGAGTLYARMTQAANLIICDNIFSNNIATTRGGGIDVELETGSINIKRNKLIDNTVNGTEGDGGGIAVTFNTSGTFEFSDNVLVGNTAARHGGGANLGFGNGVTSAYIIQNIFVNNNSGSADGIGGGLIINSDCNVTLVNNTFFGNVSSSSGGGGFGFYSESAGVSAVVFNDIYRTNLPNSVAAIGLRPIAARYSNIEGGSGESYFGAGCIDTDPLFLNPALPAGEDGDYATFDDGLQLTETSPSIDTGSASAVPVGITRDLIGNARIYGEKVDMGCYEFVPEPGAFGAVISYLLLVVGVYRKNVLKSNVKCSVYW